MATPISLQMRPPASHARYQAKQSYLSYAAGFVASRPRQVVLKKLSPRAVEQEASDMVLIPWNAEESWSEESEKLMSRLIARFKAADKDGYVLDPWTSCPIENIGDQDTATRAAFVQVMIFVVKLLSSAIEYWLSYG